jgi:hypothetical protein
MPSEICQHEYFNTACSGTKLQFSYHFPSWAKSKPSSTPSSTSHIYKAHMIALVVRLISQRPYDTQALLPHFYVIIELEFYFLYDAHQARSPTFYFIYSHTLFFFPNIYITLILIIMSKSSSSKLQHPLPLFLFHTRLIIMTVVLFPLAILHIYFMFIFHVMLIIIYHYIVTLNTCFLFYITLIWY